MEYHVITLTWYEQQMASFLGIMRQADSARRGKHVPLISRKTNDRNEINSAGAELAVAKFLDGYWNMGIDTPDLCDVSTMIEVRQTRRPKGRLLLRRGNTKDDRPYVLVRGVMPTFEIVGWMYGVDGKRPEWRRFQNTNADCWMVPVHQLRDMNELINNGHIPYVQFNLEGM